MTVEVKEVVFSTNVPQIIETRKLTIWLNDIELAFFVGIWRISWKAFNQKRDRVILYGPYPEIKPLAEAPAGSLIELRNGEFPLDKKELSKSIFEFGSAILRRKWIGKSLSPFREENDVLMMFLEFECDIFEIANNG